ncbi:MAG: hypothetical protein J5982_01030 [Bacilli bacterium]|nr:hypothetical protein [Bacilli bacterium]
MGSIDWNSDSVYIGDILKSLLDGVTDEYYAYNENIEENRLESALYQIINCISVSKPNLVSIMNLDRMGIIGDKLVKLWKLCDEDQEYFEKTITYITGTTLSKCYSVEEIQYNMNLDNPIPFIPKDDIVPFFSDLLRTDIDLGSKIVFSLRTDLVKKYNSRIKGSDLPRLSLPEKLPNESILSEDVIVNPAKLYFGKVTRDLTGGVLGLKFESFGMFEGLPNIMKVGDKIYYPLKDLEDGTFVMVDDDGVKVDWNQPIEVEGNSLLPTKEVMMLSVGPLKEIIKDAKDHCIESEIIQKYENMLKYGANLKQCNEVLKGLTSIYSALYGGIDKKRDF